METTVAVRQRKKSEGTLHFSVLISPIIPSSGSDDFVHVRVSKDYPWESAPSPAQVKSTWPCNLAFDKGEACFLQQAPSLLGCQGSIAVGYSMQMAVFIKGEPISKYKVDRAFNVAVLEVMPAYVII